MTLRFPTTLLDTWNNDLKAAVDAGSGPATIEVRTGAQPATADSSATGTLLATFTCADSAFDGSSASRVINLDAEPDLSVAAVASGTAGWARMKDSTGATVMDGSVGTSGTDFIITSTTITNGQTVTLVSGTVTQPA